MAFVKNVLTQDWWEARIQVGEASFTSNASVAVTFPAAFGQAPTVMLTLKTNPAVNTTYWVESITANGFTMRARQNVTAILAWLAVDR